MNNRKAFTLIELIIVMAIIAVIASVTFFSINPSKRIGDTQNAVRKQEALNLKQGIERFIADSVITPTILAELVVDNEYMLVTTGGEVSGTCACYSIDKNIPRIDLAGLLSAYVPNLPVDPEATGDDTGYYIKQTVDNLFSVGYCNEYSENVVAESSPSPFCGDASCNGIENASTCSGDCGASCGDTYCTHSEDCSSCVIDCGVCNNPPTVTDAGRSPINGSIAGEMLLNMGVWTDPDGDIVEYQSIVYDGSGCTGPIRDAQVWSTTRAYTANLLYSTAYSWRTKARDQNHQLESDFNTCYNFTSMPEPKSSCPFIYLWDGQKYNYLTDIKGQNIGFPPTHSRSKKIGYYIPNQVPLNGFVSEDGVYKLKFRESLKEMNYFDELKLLLVDHPVGYDIISSTADDRLTFEYKEQQNILYTIKDPRLALQAIDQDGHDVLAQVSSIDNVSAQDYDNPESYVELDFGLIDPRYSKLVIDGWSIYQLAREKREQIMPHVQVLDENSNWVTVADFGFVSGDLKTIAVDLSNKFISDDHRTRIYFGYNQVSATLLDRIRLDDSVPVDLEITTVSVSQANLYHGGLDSYEYANEEHRVQNVKDINNGDIEDFYFYGNFTKYGDVKELLDQADNKFVIFRHGDALDISFFDLEQPKNGYERTPVLYADIFYKIFYEDKSGKYGQVDNPMSIYPLPFKDMSQYPYDMAIEKYPDTKEYQDYQNQWNTRACEEQKDYCYDLDTGYRILTREQRQELDIASERILAGVPKPPSVDGIFYGDIVNVRYAKKFYDYSYPGLDI